MSRRNIVVAAAGVVAVVAAWFFLLWSPKGAELDEAASRHEAAESKVDELQNRLRSLQSIAQRRAELDARLGDLRAAVPDEPELAAFLLEADALAARTSVDFTSIAPTRPAEATGGLPPAIALNVTVEGSYFSVVDYLRQLTSLDRVVVIDRLEVAPQDPGASPRLSVNLGARMFSMQTGTSAGVPASTSPSASASSPAATSAPTPASTSTASSTTGATK